MSLLNQTAPDINLIDTQKNPVRLSEQRGSKVIIAFYPAAFSGICDQEMCTFQEQLAQLNAANATVFGISPDSPFANRKFAATYNITFPLLSDLHLEATRAYGVEFLSRYRLKDLFFSWVSLSWSHIDEWREGDSENINEGLYSQPWTANFVASWKPNMEILSPTRLKGLRRATKSESGLKSCSFILMHL